MIKQDNRYKIELAEFLDRPLFIDLLYPIYGEKSVDILFSGWIYAKRNCWYEFMNADGDILEFYSENVYVIRKNGIENKVYQLRTSRTIEQFMDDNNRFEIPLYLI